jgi:hypothetical protein
MRARILTTAAVAVFAGVAMAQERQQMKSFQIEATGGFSFREIDTGPDIEITQFEAMGTYYLAPVELKDHPWNEAAFLEHSMGVMAGLRWVDFEVGPFSADGPVVGAGFRYADKETPVAGEVNFSIGSLDGDMSTDVDITTFEGRGGYWLQSNAIVGAEFKYDELEVGGATLQEESYFGGFGKIVYDLGEGRAVNAEAGVGIASVEDAVSDEENFVIHIEGDYYFTPQYSAGALLDFSFGDSVSDEGVTFGLRGTAWINPMFSVMAEFTTFSADNDQGADSDEFGIFATFRF